MMKPILFNTDMVRAILAGRKTVTRRVLRGEAQKVASDYVRRYSEDLDTSELIVHWWVDTPLEHYVPYRPGDILYVRETWARMMNGDYWYKADGKDETDIGLKIKWRPSIHMPREAARIFLRVTDVRVERLNDIDEAGAIAEGLYEGYRYHGEGSCALSARQAFSWLWQFITLDAPAWQSWALNPWVFVVAFERCEKPEEA